MRTKSSGQSALLFLDVAHVLLTQNIPYAVVGALAAAVHGDVRGTTGRRTSPDAQAALKWRDATTDLDLLRRLTRRFGRAATDVLEGLLSPAQNPDPQRAS
jgi:hypothetical protein